MSFTGATGQTPGGIYELVSRGNKDKYFFAEPEEGAFTPFANQYGTCAAFLKETKTSTAVSEPAFGQAVEFELDRYGDVLTDVWLTIQLPSWAPESATILPGETYTDSTGRAYGWCEAAGFFLLEKIQVLQGQMVVLETSGDALYWTSGVRRRQNATELVRVLGGDYAIGPKPSVPLRVRVPFPGCQGDREGGFPLCAVPDKAYRVRVKLRAMEEIVTWGRDEEGPWGKVFTGPGGKSFVAVASKEYLAAPQIRLETTQAYVSAAVRERIVGLAAGEDGIKIPFVTHFQQTFQLLRGTRPYLLEARHPSEGMYVYAREAGAASLKDISATAIESIRFTIAGRDREYEWGRHVWVDVAEHAKMMSPPPAAGLAAINWSLGAVHRPISQDPMQRRPEGTVNFSEADKPTLYISAAAGLPLDPPVFVTVIVEGWRIYDIQGGGYGRVEFL